MAKNINLEVVKYEMVNAGGIYKVKFFSRPHPLGGVTWAFDSIVNGKSIGLIEDRNKDVVFEDFVTLQKILEREGYKYSTGYKVKDSLEREAKIDRIKGIYG